MSLLKQGDYLLAQKLLQIGGVDLTAGRGDYGRLSGAICLIIAGFSDAFQ
jgi:hypothetical protein